MIVYLFFWEARKKWEVLEEDNTSEMSVDQMSDFHTPVDKFESFVVCSSYRR